MNEDRLFCQTEDGQWQDINNGDSEDDGKPRFTVNKIATEIQKVFGNYLQLRPQGKLIPAGNGATKQLANIRSGLIKNIEQNSNSHDIYDTAYQSMLECGFGAWKVETGFAEDSISEQVIKLVKIPDAVNTVWFDPSSKEITRRDAKYAFHIEFIQFNDYKLKYPKSEVAQFPTMQQLISSETCNSYWYNGDYIAVAQYWRKVPTTKTLGLLVTGETIEITKEIEASLQNGEGAELALDTDGMPRIRQVESHRLEMFMINGGEVLSGAHSFPSPYIPLIPVIGHELMVQGTKYIRGMVRHAKDPQRIYNYSNSAFIETTAVATDQSYVIADAQVKGYEDDWSRNDNPPYKRYKHVDGLPAPQRSQPAQISPALTAQMAQSENDIVSAMGVIQTQQSLSESVTGVSFRDQMRNSDLGTAGLMSHMVMAVDYSTEIMNSMLGAVYDTEQVTRIVGDEGKTEEVQINRTERGENGKMVKLNDLSSGTYQVEADVAPSFTSQRTELLEMLQTLGNNNPMLAELTIDLQAKYMDAPFSDELHKRLRKVQIDKGLVEPTEEEVEEMGINLEAIAQRKAELDAANKSLIEAEAQLKQSQTRKNNEDAMNKAAATDKLVSDNQQTLIENRYKLLESVKIKLELGQPLNQQDAMLLVVSGEIIMDDFADSLEEREQLHAQVMQAMGQMQAQVAGNIQQPARPTAEQNVQAINMNDAGLTI